MALNLKLILHAVLEEYDLPWNGYHGVAHWARVLENGQRLAALTGADLEVVQLFALIHDSRRISEGWDPDHGPRAAEYAAELHGVLFHLRDAQFALLQRACAGHTHETHHADLTIQTCWDSDRLDLGRVGITPDPMYLGTAAARNPETIAWADARASVAVVPEFVKNDWGIDLAGWPRRQADPVAGWDQGER
ncbi:MAG TPA: hypothetical protein VKA15_01990 [Isosphaeraceae bacterium]|nr:hypothetical protein [Isosphaeraceae bacterium]